MLRENLKDAGLILNNILNQPLDVEHAHKNITLLAAAHEFKGQDPHHSDLSKILRNFAKYPESTKILIQELELLVHDIRMR